VEWSFVVILDAVLFCGVFCGVQEANERVLLNNFISGDLYVLAQSYK